MDTKYIKQLVLKDTINDIHTLEFQPGINTIIGTKGGGKSTLLKILYALHTKSSINDKDINSIKKTYGFDIVKLVYSNGETRSWDDERRKNNELIQDRYDYISQNDKIKTALDATADFQKGKEEFIKKASSNYAKSLEPFFRRYFDSFIQIQDSFNVLNNLNIKDLFELKNASHQNVLEKITTFLNHSIDKQMLDFNNKSSKHHFELIKIISLYFDNLVSYKEKIKHKDHNFISENDYEIIIQSLVKILNIHKNNIQSTKIDNVKHLATGITKFAYDKKLEQDNNNNARIASLPANLELAFENAARAIANNLANFDNFASELFHNVSIKDEGISNKDPDVKYSIDIEYDMQNTDSDQGIYYIFDKFLYKASDLLNKKQWLEKYINKYEENSTKGDFNPKNGGFKSDPYKETNTITKQLEKMFKDNLSGFVKIMICGNDYNAMSLGTRSSYGVKKTISRCKEPILFLDQPEDNIDSYTIYNSLIPLISDKNHDRENKTIQQVFIVTHNGNMGILTNPKTTTVCSFKEKDIKASYQQSSLKDILSIKEDQIINENPSAHYLEGGIDPITERLMLLKNTKEGE
ncbi:hypothetical protein [Mycoplasma sp. E35C]|uniref:hypothetical protein n=1 Tax=Mycoplasma sp. E35C TaxID=2801918 RepID=UPI0021064A2B|nr:hypothetical protein [Mycoplasma sp. E35C]